MYLSRIELNHHAVGMRDLLRVCRGDNYQIHRQVWSRAGKLGFKVAARDVRSDGYQQHTPTDKQRKITFSTLYLNGVLTVVDPERFIDVL